MSETGKNYRVKYTVKCSYENFFGKEMIVKNCWSELHAKVKLNDYCSQRYKEYVCVVITECKEETDLSGFDDIFGKGFGDSYKNESKNRSYTDLLSDIFKKKKK